jgi:hypothetical protein
VTLLLDSAALVAIERNERAMWARLKSAQGTGEPPVTHAAVVGQVWRGTPRQARLAQVLVGIDVRPVDERAGRAAGVLLGRTGLADVVDAALVVLAEDGDEIVTSDLGDFEILLEETGRHVELVRP